MFTDAYDDRGWSYGRGRDRDRRDRYGWPEDRAFREDRPRDEQRPQYGYGEADNRRFDNRDEERWIPRDETDRLISSSKVEGTPVFDRRGERLGRIESFMVAKRSGKVEYAVLTFGGFLRMGERRYPLPWEQLAFDEHLGGYVVDVTERQLERAPSHRPGEDRFSRGYLAEVNSYYGYGHPYF